MFFAIPWLADLPADRLSDVRDTSLAKLVKGDLEALILKGVLQPGQRINEPDVASRLQVSRVPVREALRSLESSGLVVSRKHSGVFVRQWQPQEIADLYQLRGLLDGFAGRCAAQLPLAQRQTLLAVLDDCAQAMATAASQPGQPGQVQRYYAANLRFHWVIVEAVGNAQLLDTYRGIVQKLHLSRLKNLSNTTGMQASIAEHADITRALAAADAPACEALLSAHVSAAFRRLPALPATLDKNASARKTKTAHPSDTTDMTETNP